MRLVDPQIDSDVVGYTYVSPQPMMVQCLPNVQPMTQQMHPGPQVSTVHQVPAPLDFMQRAQAPIEYMPPPQVAPLQGMMGIPLQYFCSEPAPMVVINPYLQAGPAAMAPPAPFMVSQQDEARQTWAHPGNAPPSSGSGDICEHVHQQARKKIPPDDQRDHNNRQGPNGTTQRQRPGGKSGAPR